MVRAGMGWCGCCTKACTTLQLRSDNSLSPYMALQLCKRNMEFSGILWRSVYNCVRRIEVVALLQEMQLPLDHLAAETLLLKPDGLKGTYHHGSTYKGRSGGRWIYRT
ncbi:hypothetical protein GDO81_029291 [Engystomops pustulosus]|uniref:Uncharacterized protein n=1 Tax=Engystomops pustulosus TaxID=76066 RepID=A0AAV6YJM7_ENGPU|nr:hypothetical protein GDO81_029291 [Engystomops pustulosus]